MCAKRLACSLIVVGVLTLCRPLGARGQDATPRSGIPEIVSAGTGAVTVPPQRVSFHISISAHAASAAAAAAQGATMVRAVFDTLIRAGFRRESLQTLTIGVGPSYDFGNGRKLIDYAAYSAIRVSLRDLNSIGRVIDLALAAGATEVGSLAFESDTTDVARHRAMAQAFAKARDDAATMAAAAGGKLGRLIEATTRDDGYGGMAYAFAPMQGPPGQQTPIVPRDVTIRVFVQTRWQFVP